MRLDKFLCEMNIGSRSQVKAYVKQGQVTVNGKRICSSDQKINEYQDVVTFQGRVLRYQQFHYYVLNKPRGVVTATKDNTCSTVMDLFPTELRKNLFPVGRLDKDTEGLLLITDDGDLAHRMLSPTKHVDKTYQVTIAHSLSEDESRALEQGVDIGEDNPTRPAKVEILEENLILLTIHEGKFHQVKRMLKAVDNEVTALKRIAFGPLSLDANLESGAYRELTEAEVQLLHEK